MGVCGFRKGLQPELLSVHMEGRCDGEKYLFDQQKQLEPPKTLRDLCTEQVSVSHSPAFRGRKFILDNSKDVERYFFRPGHFSPGIPANSIGLA